MNEINKIIQGDALQVLKTLPDESINCCMTSPPYWALRDYGTASWEGGDINCNHQIPDNEKDPKNPNAGSHISRFNKENCYKCGAKRIDKQLGLEITFQEYISKLCDIFDEVKRVLRNDGTCWVNLGDTYSATRWTGNGKGQPMNKFKDGHRDIAPQKVTDLEDKNLTLIPFRFAIEMQNRGWIIRNVIIWHKPNCMPSSVKDRFTVDFEYLFFFVKSKKYWFETQYEPLAESSFNDKRKDRGLVLNKKGKSLKGKYSISGTCINSEGRIKRTVWEITTKPFPEAHFAVYPEELCETPIKAGCPEFVCNKCGKPREKLVDIETSYDSSKYDRHGEGVILGRKEQPHGCLSSNWTDPSIKKVELSDCGCSAGFSGGIVLDPFIGSGTTALVALKQNKKFIGIELNPKYITIAEDRIKPFLEQTKL